LQQYSKRDPPTLPEKKRDQGKKKDHKPDQEQDHRLVRTYRRGKSKKGINKGFIRRLKRQDPSMREEV